MISQGTDRKAQKVSFLPKRVELGLGGWKYLENGGVMRAFRPRRGRVTQWGSPESRGAIWEKLTETSLTRKELLGES